ncbi:flagellin [Paludibacterium purpuratum]|uniref:Flagellin n=1 Tax=Paludibacterium purpuratum TaxID=1144873 RepID=A0A4R7B861_9NEIS|nr:flagellin [Paludibacterium purpuratum]TDR79777.1 flagellin [Paludibacterium purpuratum]
MALTVNTNTASLDAQRAHSRNQQAVNQVLAQLASGSRINSAADDPAGLAITQGLTTQVNGDQQALTNANDGISLTQTASAALGQIQQNTQQIQQLALQASNGILSNSDRQALQQQVDQLTQANSQIVQTTQFNGTALLSGNNATTFQVGPNGTANNQISLNASGLDNAPASGGLNGYNANLAATHTIDISTQANALNATSQLTQDLNTLSNTQATVGATQNSFSATINNLANTSLNTQEARSRISDTDFAAATAALAQNQILAGANIATLSQANVSQSAALTLLR